MECRSLTGGPIQGALIPQDGGGFGHLIVFAGVSVAVEAVVIWGARMVRARYVLRG